MKTTANEIGKRLIAKLWEKYLERVPYALKYKELVSQKGGRVINDHVAFRTFNTHTGEQPEGIQAISHIIAPLGYQPAGKYNFPRRKLNAVHYEHPDELMPKIFVSQLEVNQLPVWAQNLIHQSVRETPYLLTDSGIALLNLLQVEGALTNEAAEVLVDDLIQYFRRPWNAPSREALLKINDLSQYAAWVLLHGNSVNHFTAFINYQDVKEWPDLESTCKALAKAGIPMKEKIEGKNGGKLQQSATFAVKEDTDVKGDDGVEKICWPYAYYELAQRGFVKEKGRQKLFSGFLGDQAIHLFEMTRTREN